MGLTNTALPHDIARTFPVLVVAEVVADRAEARSAHEIEERLLTKDLHVVRANSLFDAETAVASDAGFSCVVLSWGLCAKDLAQGLRVIDLIRRRTSGLPILLAMTREDRSRVPLAYVENMDGFIWLPEDSPDFIAGRIEAAARRYLDSMLPPFFGALVNFAETHEYSWHTPGHTGGTAFMKTAVGRDVSRVLRRADAALGSLGLGRRARFAERSQRPVPGGRGIRRARVRRGSHVLLDRRQLG